MMYNKYMENNINDLSIGIPADERKPAPMHKYLTGFDDFTTTLPLYVENPFSQEQVEHLKSIIRWQRSGQKNYELISSERLPSEGEQYMGSSRFDPKKIVFMSREMIEFVCPEDIEKVMDSYCKPLHNKEIKLTHYNYIDYRLEHGDGRFAPQLPPHIDADENLVTFNYCLDQNVEDWDVWIDDKPYSLKKGDAVIFSAVNHVHWRPKRKWKKGEFVEIVSFDYCPTTSYRWTGELNPIDPVLFPEAREAYSRSLIDTKEFKKAWQIYNKMGLESGIPLDKNFDFL